MKKNSTTLKPMVLPEYSDLDGLDYPVYLQRRFYGIQALYFHKGKFRFEKEVEARSNDSFLSFYKIDLTDKEEVVLDGYFTYDGGDSPGKRQRMKFILENPGESMTSVRFIVYDGFFPGQPNLTYEQRLTKLVDLCSKAYMPCVNTTMSVRADSYTLLIHYYKMLTAGRESGNGVFIRTTHGVYKPGLISTQACVVSNFEPRLTRELVSTEV